MNVIKPLITEKTLNLATRGWYTFGVAKGAKKTQIAQEIEALYKVNVKVVRTISVHGKFQKVGRKRQAVQRSDWKKAIVSLPAGEHIEAFEVTQEGQKK